MAPVYGLFIAYLLCPKIDLLPIGGSAIRVTDIIFLVAVGIYLATKNFRVTLFPILNRYLVFLSFFLLTYAVNLSDIGSQGMLHILRPIQYLTWALIGYDLASHLPRERFVTHMTMISGVLCLWAIGEWFEIIPKFGKFVGASARASVNTSGPYEIAALSTFFLFVSRQASFKVPALIVLLLSQARVTIVAALALTVSRRAVLIIAPLVVLGLMPFLVSLWSSSRFAEIPSFAEAWKAFQWFWAFAPITESHESYMAYTHSAEGNKLFLGNTTDLSFELRAFRWATIIKSISVDPVSVFIGAGPGAWGVAVDSYFVRVFGEAGILGLLAFLYFWGRSVSEYWGDITARQYILCLLATGLLIDIFVSDKPMSIFWIYIGFVTGERVWRAPAKV